MGPEMLFLLLKALISITAPFSPTRICFGPVLALSSALSLQSSLSKSIDIERPIRENQSGILIQEKLRTSLRGLRIG